MSSLLPTATPLARFGPERRPDSPVRRQALQLAVRLGVAALLLSPSRVVEGQAWPPDTTLRRWLSERVANGYATGILVARRDGARDHIVAVGGSQRDGKALDGNSYFEIGSITKVFTNILLADMVLRGEVALDDPVQRFLPAGVTMPSRNGKAITLLDLATASSGLPSLPTNLVPRDVGNPYADYTVEQMYAYLSAHTLRRDPGERYEYSNLGMGLLGHVLGLRTGRSYEQLLRQRVLEPLGMRDTYITIPAGSVGRFAVPHDADLEPVAPWDIPTLAGAGALRSTARDMLRFADAVVHRDRGPLGKAIALSMEPRRPTTIPGMRIALGWHVREANGRQIVWHNGGTGGFRAFFGVDPATGRHVMAWSNTSQSVDDLGLHLLDSTVALRPTPPLATVAVAPDALRRFVGKYPLAPAFVVSVTEEGGKLFAQPTGQARFRLWPESTAVFTLRAVPARVSFAPDSTGAMTLTLDQGGRKQTARRASGDSAGSAAAQAVAAPPRTNSGVQPAIRRLNPPTLSTPTGYTHVVEASGGRTLYISGQVALDSAGQLVGGGDFRAQVEQVFRNLQRALAAGGATFDDVVKTTTYVTDAAQVAVLREVRSRYLRPGALPASTFVQVAGLARPEWLVEIEAIAVAR